jgi:hypothetical protein
MQGAAKPVSPEQKGNGSQEATVQHFFIGMGALAAQIFFCKILQCF